MARSGCPLRLALGPICPFDDRAGIEAGVSLNWHEYLAASRRDIGLNVKRLEANSLLWPTNWLELARNDDSPLTFEGECKWVERSMLTRASLLFWSNLRPSLSQSTCNIMLCSRGLAATQQRNDNSVPSSTLSSPDPDSFVLPDSRSPPFVVVHFDAFSASSQIVGPSWGLNGWLVRDKIL